MNNNGVFPTVREMETNNHPILLVFLSAFSRVEKLRSLLCASFYTAEDKQKPCPILDDYLFPAPLHYRRAWLVNYKFSVLE